MIFAVGNVDVRPGRRNYLDVENLLYDTVSERRAAIKTLIGASVHTCTVDVQPEDQLLLLVTCVDDLNERRVVAARRIRDGENLNGMRMQVNRSRSK